VYEVGKNEEKWGIKERRWEGGYMKGYGERLVWRVGWGVFYGEIDV